MALFSIPLQQIPAQGVAVVLGNQACVITLRQIGGRQYLSMSVAGVPVCNGVLLVNRSNIVRAGYRGFVGELIISDTQGDDAPAYSGWGSRWLLLYNDASV